MLARAFGPEGAGVYAFNFAIATILYEIVALGIEEYGVREFAREQADGRARLIGRLLKVQTAIALLGCTVLLLLSPALQGANLTLLALMVLYQLAFAAARTLFIPAFVTGHLAIQMTGEVMARSGALLFAIVAIQQSAKPSLAFAVTGLPLFALCLLVVAVISARTHGGVTLDRAASGDALQSLRQVWSFAAANLLSSIYGRTGVLVLFLMLGERQAGLFSSAFKFVEVGWTVLALVPWAGYPLLTRAFSERSGEFRTVAKQVLHGTVLCGLLLAWGLFWVIPWLMGPLLGPNFAAAIPVVKVFAGLMVLLAISEYLERMLLVADLQVTRLKVVALQAVLNLILNIALVPWAGMFGTVIAFMLTQGFTIFAYLWTLRSRTPMGWVLRDSSFISVSLLVALVIGAAMLNFEFRAELAAFCSLVVLLLWAIGMSWRRYGRKA